MSYSPIPQTAHGSNPNDLDAPLYGATVGQAVTRFFKKYATFSGRASRSEFWWWTLVSLVISVVFFLIDLAAAGGDVTAANASATGPGDILSYVWGLAVLVPGLAVAVRRLHDTNRSGWWYLLILIPLVGAIVLIVFWASASDPSGARFDRNAGALASGARYA